MDKPLERYPKILIGNRPRTLGELYSNKTRWNQGSSGRSQTGKSVVPLDPVAVSWCLSGGIALVYDETKEALAVTEKLLAWIRKQVDDPETDDPASIEAWNDHEGTTFKDVRKAVVELGI